MIKVRVYRVTPCHEVFTQRKDLDYLTDEKLGGRPFPGRWRRIELSRENQEVPRLDFYAFGRKGMVCSDRARLECAPLEDSGEFFPVKISGLKGTYFIYNVTNCGSHLDAKKTRWERSVAKGMLGAIIRPAFHADRMQGDFVFKVPEDGAAAIYCPEYVSGPAEDHFKELVESNGLTGLSFELAWSSYKKPR